MGIWAWLTGRAHHPAPAAAERVEQDVFVNVTTGTIDLRWRVGASEPSTSSACV